MFCAYIIFSEKLNRFYIGTTDNFADRFKEHNSATYSDSYTAKGIPWSEFIVIKNLVSKQAYSIEKHIKNMKSKKYIFNLKRFPNIVEALIIKYKD